MSENDIFSLNFFAFLFYFFICKLDGSLLSRISLGPIPEVVDRWFMSVVPAGLVLPISLHRHISTEI
jgi:hypothetical protein